MVAVQRLLLICIIQAGLFLPTAQIMTAASQPSEDIQPILNEALVLVQRAEAAGATGEEVGELVLLLNKALQLKEEVTKLSALEAESKTELLNEFNETLDTIETKASQMETIASQRTFANRVAAYVSGGIAAFIATFAYFFGMHFWRKYRIKRTFQMRFFPK